MVKRRRRNKLLKAILSRKILKATKLEYAKEMIKSGEIQFGYLGYYKELESDKERGDQNEGEAVVNFSGVDVSITNNGEAYIFCASKKDVSMVCLKNISLDNDCYVVVNSVEALANRIKDYIKKASLHYKLIHGPVNYTRGLKISQKQKDNYSFADSFFQKDDSYKNQNEYRFCLYTIPSLIPVPAAQTKPTCLKDFASIRPDPAIPEHEAPDIPSELGRITKEKNWIIKIGNCEDIMKIVPFK